MGRKDKLDLEQLKQLAKIAKNEIQEKSKPHEYESIKPKIPTNGRGWKR